MSACVRLHQLRQEQACVRRLDVSSFAHQLPVGQPICTQLKESWRCSEPGARDTGDGSTLPTPASPPSRAKKQQQAPSSSSSAPSPAEATPAALAALAALAAAEQPAFAACTLGRYPPPDHLAEPNRTRSVKVACRLPTTSNIQREATAQLPQLLLSFCPKRAEH